MVTDVAPSLEQGLTIRESAELIFGPIARAQRKWHYRDTPDQYAPLTETELQGSLEEKLSALSRRRDNLQEQLFFRIQRRRVGGKEFHFEYKLPTPVLVESDWQAYLQGEANFHHLAKRQAALSHDVEATRQHELEEQRTNLAIGALNGDNNRGDLVIDYAKRIQAKTHQELEEREVLNRRPGTSSSAIQEDLLHTFPRLWVRADFCDKVVAAMEQRFPQKK